MNTETGDIYNSAFMAQNKRLMESLTAQNKLQMMEVEPTAKQLSRTPPRVGFNEPCPCGSGRKFKRCCKWHPEFVGGKLDAELGGL